MATTSVDLTDLELACGLIHDFYFSNHDKHKYYSGQVYGYPTYDDRTDKSPHPSSQMTYSQAKVSRKTIKFNNTGDRLYFVLGPSNFPDVITSAGGNVHNGFTEGGISEVLEYQYLPGAVNLTVPWDITTIDLSTLAVYRPGSSLYDAYVNTDRSLGSLILSPSDDGNLMRLISGTHTYINNVGDERLSEGVMGITAIDPSTEAFGWNQFNTILTRNEMTGFAQGVSGLTSGGLYNIYEIFIAPTALDPADAYKWQQSPGYKFNKIFVAANTRYLSAFSGYLISRNIELFEITDRTPTDDTTKQNGFGDFTSDWYLDGGAGAPERVIREIGNISTRVGGGHFAFANNGMRLFTSKFILDLDSPYYVDDYSINTTESYDINGGVPDKLTENYDQGFTCSPDGKTIFFFENTDVRNNHGTLWAYTRNPIYVPDAGGGSVVGGGSGNASSFGFQVFDSSGVKRFDSLDVTWNQVAFYQVTAGQTGNFNIPSIAGKTVAVGQIMINPQIFTRKAIAANVVVDGTTVSVSGHSEDIYVLVLVKG